MNDSVGQVMENPEDESELLKKENEMLRNSVKNFKIEFNNLKLEYMTYRPSYCYEVLCDDTVHFRKATGLELDSFNELFTFLEPGINYNNIKFYEANFENKDVATDSINTSLTKCGPKPKIDARNQLFMCLSWLKNGFTLSHISWLFNTPKSNVSRNLITCINFIFFSLGEIPIWPSRKQIDETMPESFKKTYPSTICTLDCTELFCQRPSSLSIQSSWYSSYKHHVTHKGLIGIAPSRAITYVSQLYPGPISVKELVAKSEILNDDLWGGGVSVMADRGFLIHEKLEKIGISLNIPAFLGGNQHLTNAEVKESQTKASVRIHAERAIQHIKNVCLIRNKIPLNLHGSTNQIWTVCALLCNFMPPLIVKNAEHVESTK